MSEIKIKNALQYIKESHIFTDDKYNWIKSLLNKILNDEVEEKTIRVFVENLFPDEVDKEKTKEIFNKPEEETQISSETIPLLLTQIISIDFVNNTGLLNISEPIKLNSGLNIFYGKNASGKSTLYLALCKALGFDEKLLFTNLNSGNPVASSKISCLLSDGQTIETTWSNISKSPKTNVQIFDSQISSYLCETDQINKFEFIHLKQEYFIYLNQFLNEVAKELSLKLTFYSQEFDKISVNLEKIFPLIKDSHTKLKEDLDDPEKQFTKENEQELQTITQTINSLQSEYKSISKATYYSIVTDIDRIQNILGLKVSIEQDDNKEEAEYYLYYSVDNLEEINKKIELFKSLKSAATKTESDRLRDLIPDEWIGNDKWELFIKRSIDFLESLTPEIRSTYTERICIYCQQPLATAEAQSLITIYKDIQKSYKDNLSELDLFFQNSYKKAKSTIDQVIDISKINENIKLSLGTIGREGKLLFDLEKGRAIIKIITERLEEREKIKLEGEDLIYIKNVWNEYEGIKNDFEKLIKDLDTSSERLQEKINELEKSVEVLKYLKTLNENKSTLLKYIKLIEVKQEIVDKIEDVTNIKRQFNTLATRFYREEPIHLFEDILNKEYQFLNFTPSPIFKISTRTNIDKTMRVYSMGEKNISQIFSEGERKIHALADFFANCRINNYKGVYIFDDPVNSLDEDNIINVSDRILELVKEGNQIIVFTHNLFFLYSLVKDFSSHKINMVKKAGLTVRLDLDINPEDTSEMKRRFKEIKRKLSQYSAKNCEEVSEYERRGTYDLISGYLESFVEQILFKGVISRYRPNIRMASLNKLSGLSTENIDKVSAMYERTSRFCARHSQPPEVPTPDLEVLKKDIIKLLEEFPCN